MTVFRSSEAAGASLALSLATRDLDLAARCAERLILLHSGEVAVAGSAAEVLTARNLARCYGVR